MCSTQAVKQLARLTVLPFDGDGERTGGLGGGLGLGGLGLGGLGLGGLGLGGLGGLGGGDFSIPMVSETSAAKMHKKALEIICRRCLRFLAAS
jgi:hypothetical protein